MINLPALARSLIPHLDAFCEDAGFDHWSFYRASEGGAAYHSNLPQQWHCWARAHAQCIYAPLRQASPPPLTPVRWNRQSLERHAPLPDSGNGAKPFEGLSLILVDSETHYSVFSVMSFGEHAQNLAGQQHGQLAWLAGVLHHHLYEEQPVADQQMQLTQRQRDVLRLLVHGSTPQQVAGELGVTLRTVRFHQRQILERMDARSLAVAAFKAGLLGLV